MGQLTNLYVSESYQGLIKLTDSTTGVTGTLQYLQDGIGNRLPIQMSTSSVSITGSLHGTASYATQALSASYAPMPDVSGFATTGSNTFYGNQSIISPNAEALFVSGASQRFRGNSLSVEDNNSVTKFIVSNAANIVVSDLPVSASQGITGSLFGTASYATQALSASWAPDNIDSGSYVTTSSFNAFTASIDGRVDALEVETGSLQNQINQKLDTGSFNSYTSSNDGKVNSLISKTGSYATTGSNSFIGNQGIFGDIAITGSLTAYSASITYLTTIYQTSSVIFTSGSNVLGDEASDIQLLWGKVVLPSGPLSITGSAIISDGITGSLFGNASTATSASHAVNADAAISSSQAQNAVSSSYSLNSTSASFATNAISSSHSVNSDVAISSSFAQNANTASYIKDSILNQNLNITGSLTASGLNYPIVDNGAKSFIQTDGNGNLSLEYVQTVYENVRNTNAFPIVKGSPVYVSGSTGANANVFYSDASDPSTMPAVYIAGETLAPGQTGIALASGLIEGIDTTGFPAGTIVYVAEGGGWSSSRPTGSTSTVQALGVVTKEGVGGQGVIINQLEALLPNIQTGYMWVGDGTNQPVQVSTSSLSVASAVSASFATNALSASYAPQDPLPSGVVSGSQQIVDLGFATTSSVNEKLDTGSFNTYTASMDARTGSYATTGSNVFIGDQTITGSVNVRSGSLELISNNTTLNPDNYITNSVGGQSNILLGWGSNPAANGPGTTQANFSASLRLDGSNNIVAMPTLRAVGANGDTDQEAYISGSGNIILGNIGNIFLNTGSLLVPKVQSNLLSNGSAIYLRYTTSSLAAGQPSISSNMMVGGYAKLNHPSGSGNFNANYIANGNVTSNQTFTSNNRVTIVANNVLASVLLNNISSSISYQNNYNNSPVTVNNHLSSSNHSNNALNITNNAIFGGSSTTGISIWASGSQSTNVSRNIIDNVIGGKNIIISSSFVSSSASSLVSSVVYGQNLTVSGSHSATVGGSAFFGRYNGLNGLEYTQDIVFAVGTGTGTSNRRTGFYITSGSLVGVSGSLDVKGNTTMTGSLGVSDGITGSLEGTASYASMALTASFALNGGGGSAFPYVGNAEITGSLIVTGDITSNNNLVSAYSSGDEGGEIKLALPQTNTTLTGSVTIDVNGNRVRIFETGGTNRGGYFDIASLGASVGTNLAGGAAPFPYVGTATITGSLIVTGSASITGSVNGNVNALSISSQTASLDLNNGNFFTLQLVSGSATHINPSNIKPGQTVNILLNTTGSGTVTFPTTVKQISGSSYVPTTTTGQDVITLISFDSSTLFLANVKNLV